MQEEKKILACLLTFLPSPFFFSLRPTHISLVKYVILCLIHDDHDVYYCYLIIISQCEQILVSYELATVNSSLHTQHTHTNTYSRHTLSSQNPARLSRCVKMSSNMLHRDNHGNWLLIYWLSPTPQERGTYFVSIVTHKNFFLALIAKVVITFHVLLVGVSKQTMF